MQNRLVPAMRQRILTANAGIALFVAAVVIGLTGCQHTSTPPARARRPSVMIQNGGSAAGDGAPTLGIPIGATDACAANLHDLAGSFLLYYAMRHELPQTLDALSEVDTINTAELTCPISHRRYIYNPRGVLAPGNNGRAVLYDAAPSHNGMRYALAITEPRGNAALVAKVIAIPEPTFAAAAAAAAEATEPPQQQQPSPEPARPPQRTPEER